MVLAGHFGLAGEFQVITWHLVPTLGRFVCESSQISTNLKLYWTTLLRPN